MNKQLITHLLAATLIYVAGPALAQQLTGDEIKKLLAGNTVEQTQFVPKKMTFLSYYDVDGSIMALSGGGQVNTGKWLIKEDGVLCIQWPGKPDSCVKILKEQDGTYKRVDVEKGEVRAVMKNITPGKLF